MLKSAKFKEVLHKFINSNPSNGGVGLFQLGLMYFYGNSYPQDINKGISLIEHAGTIYPYAYTFLGLAYLNGEVVQKNEKKGLTYLRKGQHAGDSEASLQLSNIYLHSKLLPQNKDKALKLLEEAIKKGHPEAMMNLGILYLGSTLVPINYQKAFQLFQEADRLNNFNATAFLGLMYEKGYFVQKDLAKALRLYLKGTSGNSPIAHYFLGKLYQSGEFVQKNIKEAMSHFEIAAAYGYSDAIHRLIDIYLDENSPEWNVYFGRAYLEKLLEEEDPLAYYKYGKYLLSGIYYKKNIKKGLKYLREADIKEAYYLLGNTYYEGQIVNQNLDLALTYYLKGSSLGCPLSKYKAAEILMAKKENEDHLLLINHAIALGNLNAYYLLGKCYQYGIGVSQNIDKAISFYLIASNADSFYNLGLFYMNNDNKDIDLALYYLEESHKLGGIEASYILGSLYYQGQDVPQDSKKGLTLLKHASSHGSKDAALMLATISFDSNDEKNGFKYLIDAIKLGSFEAKTLYLQKKLRN
ncbi:MAG TPA: hypothetical protein VIK94_01185 [Bacilli bacterium]